jgi:hypothetical protein
MLPVEMLAWNTVSLEGVKVIKGLKLKQHGINWICKKVSNNRMMILDEEVGTLLKACRDWEKAWNLSEAILWAGF